MGATVLAEYAIAGQARSYQGSLSVNPIHQAARSLVGAGLPRDSDDKFSDAIAGQARSYQGSLSVNPIHQAARSLVGAGLPRDSDDKFSDAIAGQARSY